MNTLLQDLRAQVSIVAKIPKTVAAQLKRP